MGEVYRANGLEKYSGINALVMELVEGPTLADRIAQVRFPSTQPSPSRGRSPTLSKPRTSVLYEMLTIKRALDGEDVTEGLSISRSTVTQEWQTARALTHRRLTDALARGDP